MELVDHITAAAAGAEKVSKPKEALLESRSWMRSSFLSYCHGASSWVWMTAAAMTTESGSDMFF